MRVDNWESKLNAVIHDTIHNKGDYVLGKNDCGLFVVSCIESIIGKKVFDGKYKTFNQLKKIFKQLKSKNLLNLSFVFSQSYFTPL